VAGKQDILINFGAQAAPGTKEAFAKLFNEAGAEGQRNLLKQFDQTQATVEVVIQPRFAGKGLEKEFKGFEAVLVESGGALNKLTKEQEKLEKSLNGSVTSLRQQLNTFKQIRDGLPQIENKVDQYGKKIKVANAEWLEADKYVKQIGRALQIASASNFWDKIKAELNLGPLLNAGRTINDLVNTFQSLSIIIGQVLAPINTLIETLGRLQQIDLTFKSIGQGPAEIAQVFADSSDIAIKYGVSLNTVRDGFTQLTPTVVAAGGTIDDTSNIIDALSSRFATFGLSADKSKRVMNGIIQAFGKGKLMAEELTQQISEADPAFRVDLAKALNITVAELGEVVKAGELTTDVLIDIIPQLKKTSSTFGQLGTSAVEATISFLKGAVTIEQVRNQINTLNQLNLEKLANAFKPLLASFLAIQAALTDFTTSFLKLDSARTIIEFFNSLGLSIAAAVTVISKFVLAVLQTVDPVFKLVNAIDSAGQSLIGFRPIITTIAVLLTGAFAKSLFNVVGGLSKVQAAVNITKEILGGTFTGTLGNVQKALGGLQGAFGGLKAAPAAAGSAFDGFLSKLTGLDVAQLRSRQATNTFRKELSYLPADLTQASVEAARLGQSGGRAASGLGSLGNQVKSTTQVLVENADQMAALTGQTKTLSAGTFALGSAVLAGVALWTTYERAVAGAKEEIERLNGILKGLRDELAKYKTSLQVSQNATDDFAQKLSKLPTKEAYGLSSAFDEMAEILSQFDLWPFGDTDLQTAQKIEAATSGLNEAYKTVGATAKETEKAIADYNAEASSPEATAAIVKQTETTIKSYDAIIESAKRLRDEYEKEATKSGGGLSESEKAKLLELNKVVDLAIAKRKELVKLAKEKGVPLGVEIAGVDTALDTVSELEEKLKEFKQIKADAQVGTKGREKIEQDIIAVEGILKALSTNITEAKIKISYEEDKAGLENAVSVADALLDKYQAVQDLNQAGFNVTKSTLSYRIQEVEAAKAAAEERGASATEIKGYENQIKGIKDQERAIERQALLARIQGIAGAQAQERQILLLKQAQQRLEADSALSAAQRALVEAKLASLKAKQNEEAAKAKGATQAELTALNNIYQQTLEVQRIASRQVEIENGRVATLGTVQRLEQETLAIKQQTERKTLDAQAAQIGLNTKIGEGAAAAGKIGAGFVQVGDKVVQIYQDTSNLSAAAKSAAGSYGELGAKARDAASNIKDTGISSIKAASDTGTAVGGAAKKFNELSGAAASIESELQNVSNSAEAAASNAGDLQSQINNTNANVYQDVSSGLGGVADKAGTLQANLTGASSAAGTLGTPIDNLAASATDFAGASSNFASNISNIPVNQINGIANSFRDAGEAADLIAQADISGAVSSAITPANNFKTSLERASTAVNAVDSKLRSLDGTTITVNVDVRGGVPGLWTGGPVTAGSMYRVNELGKEAFLSASGRLSMINKPAFGEWRAPSAGTVIPAHLTSMLNIPRGGVKLPSGASTRVSRATQGLSGGKGIARAITSALRASGSDPQGQQARIQAAQAMQLGRLTTAIHELTRKNWNVDVKVRNTGNAAYLDALNQRL
jgi:tape measure domain-containing protein